MTTEKKNCKNQETPKEETKKQKREKIVKRNTICIVNRG